MDQRDYIELKALSEAIVMADNGTICYANDAAVELLGSECIGQSCSKYLTDDFLDGGRAVETELRGSRYSAVSARCGDLIQIILTRLDGNEAVVSLPLLSSMRNSLMTLGLLSERLRKRCEDSDDEELKNLSITMTGTYFKLRRNIGNLEIVTGQCVPKRVITDVSQHLERLINTVKSLFPEIGFTFKAPKNVLAEIDRELFDRMILNLVSNCIRHNSLCAAVSINLHTTPTHVLISVADNGSGISDKDMQSIFEKYSIDAPAPQIHGGALYGLSAARRIASLHGGTVMLNTGETGTTVMISVKRADARKMKEIPEELIPMELILTALSDCVDGKFFSNGYIE